MTLNAARIPSIPEGGQTWCLLPQVPTIRELPIIYFFAGDISQTDTGNRANGLYTRIASGRCLIWYY